MAPSDRQPVTKAGKATSSSSQRTPHTICDEGPTDITKRLSTIEKTQRLLRILSANISENNLLAPISGWDRVDPTRFVLGIVGSMKVAERRWFQDTPIVLIEADSQYIDPPKEDGRKQPPVMATHFVFGDKHPDKLASDPRISSYIHDIYIKFAPMGDTGETFYLFPVEAGITTALQRISTAPPPPIEGVAEQSKHFVDVSSLGRYLPGSPEEARRILVAHEVIGGAPLDINNIHDSLEEVTLVQFAGEEKKTTMPFAILKLSGGASFRLYPYGKYPPRGEITQGCEVILSEQTYYLIMPDMVARELENRFMSNHLSLGQ